MLKTYNLRLIQATVCMCCNIRILIKPSIRITLERNRLTKQNQSQRVKYLLKRRPIIHFYTRYIRLNNSDRKVNVASIFIEDIYRIIKGNFKNNKLLCKLNMREKDVKSYSWGWVKLLFSIRRHSHSRSSSLFFAF